MKFKLGRTKSLFSSVFFLMLTMVLLFGMVYGIRYVCYKQGDTNMPIYKVDTDDKKISLSLLIEYINKHYDSITLESLAQKFHYASASMSRYIKQQTGRTFSDIVRSIRLKNAYYLLSYTNLSIEEIADKLGYHERSYFEKIFKQYCGITPAEYRKKHTTLKKFNTI